MEQPAKSEEKGAAIGAGSAETGAEAALVELTTPRENSGSLPMNAAIARIPIEVDVAIPIRNFRVRNLLALEPGRVVESMWLQGEDLPLAAPGAQLAWSEFEVIDQKLAVRITRLV